MRTSQAAHDRAAFGSGDATEEALDLYRSMCIIRAVELRIESLHKRGQLSGSFHSSMGQEAAAAGVCAQLTRADMVTSTHRGHGHAIAKGTPPVAILAELYGRVTGVSGGRGGSMHLHHRESGFLGQNAIVGGGLPWAAGAAWARRRVNGGEDIAVAFTGDGAVAQGVFHETLLLARVWSSPCLFVCENNGLAHSMSSEGLFGVYGSIAKLVEPTGIRVGYADGRDVLEVAAVAKELVSHARAGNPAFLECGVFRVRPHSISDADYRYREREAGERWLEVNDPILNLRTRLGERAEAPLAAIDAEIEQMVDTAVAEAAADEETPATAALAHVYTDPELQARV